MRRLDHLGGGCGLRLYTRMSSARLLLLLSPTVLLLLLWTAPQTHAQQSDSMLTDIQRILNMTRWHVMTMGTVLENVKLMNERMETLESTVADIACKVEDNDKMAEKIEEEMAKQIEKIGNETAKQTEKIENEMAKQTEKIENEMAKQTEKIENEMAKQTEKVENEMAKQTEKLAEKIENQTEEIYTLETNITRILEPMVTDVNELRKNPMPRDCSDIAKGKNSGSGTYYIFPGGEAVHVYCDIEGSEGWTVLQRRVNETQDFDKDWVEYKTGFGDLEGEHWVGNEYMHALTSHRTYMIQFVLGGCSQIGDVLVGNYRVFRVGNETSGYKLTVDGFTGNATDGMNGCDTSNHNEMRFTTRDRDNDRRGDENCAQKFPGAWWFHSCYCSHLNRQGLDGWVFWNYDRSPRITCKKTKMRIKPLIS